MKQMVLRIHNYEECYRIFPCSGTVRDDGTPNLSWQVGMTPEQYRQETGDTEMMSWSKMINPVFEKIDPNKPWDSPENKAAYAVQIPFFLNSEIPVQPNEFITHYAGNIHLFVPGKGFRGGKITDGLSNTLAIGEVTAGFKSWGDPDNVRDPGLGLGKTPTQFGGPFPGGTFLAFADGHTNFISDKIDPRVLKALATPNGGEKTERF